MLELELTNKTNLQIDQFHLQNHLEDILQRLITVGKLDMLGPLSTGQANTEMPYIIEINLVEDKEIQALNAHYLGHNQPTDVLSFENPASVSGKVNYFGSITISTETAQIQAKEAGIKPQNEVETLAGHGLLHLLGYHHN